VRAGIGEGGYHSSSSFDCFSGLRGSFWLWIGFRLGEGVLGSPYCVGKNLQFCFISYLCLSLRGRVSVNVCYVCKLVCGLFMMFVRFR
jgi:hypothetical protein